MTVQPARSTPAAHVPEPHVPEPTSSPDAASPAKLWVERTGTRTYTGRSSLGAEVLVGPTGSGAVFSPGELLKIALAACSAMTSDSALARRLGADYAATVHVVGPKDPDEDRYLHLQEELEVDLSGLDEAARERLLAVVHRAIEGHCTVARTLNAGATVGLTVTGKR